MADTMRAFYVEADHEPREGYKMSEREITTGRALRGNQIWRNLRRSGVAPPRPTDADAQLRIQARS